MPFPTTSVNGWSVHAALAISCAMSLAVSGAPVPLPSVASSHDTLPPTHFAGMRAFSALPSITTSSPSFASFASRTALAITTASSLSSSTLTSLNPSTAASAASAEPTVLAFHIVAPPAAPSKGTDDKANAASFHAESAPDGPDSQFYLSYTDPWSSSIDSLAVSLPNVTAHTDSTDDSIPDDEGLDGDGYSQFFAKADAGGYRHRGDRRPGNSSLTYRIFFPENFDFGLDARLPSIFSGRAGCSQCFSSRLRYGPDGTGELFMYNPTQKQASSLCDTIPGSTCSSDGLHIGQGAFKFVKGKWMTVRQDLWLNTAGQNDGGFSVWLDGTLVLHADNVHYIDFSRSCSARPGRRPLGSGNELYDACLPNDRRHWAYYPIRHRTPRPVTVIQPTTIPGAPITITKPMTITKPVTIVVTQPVTVPVPVTQTQEVQVPVEVPVTVLVPVTEIATVTVTETAAPEPTEPPAEEEPAPEEPAPEDPPEEDPPAEEEAIPAMRVAQTPASDISDMGKRYDDGMWKGINGYPGDPGNGKPAAPAPPVGPGVPYTFSWTQVVTLPGAMQTVTVTSAKLVTKTATVPAKPTPPKPKKKKP